MDDRSIFPAKLACFEISLQYKKSTRIDYGIVLFFAIFMTEEIVESITAMIEVRVRNSKFAWTNIFWQEYEHGNGTVGKCLSAD